MSWAASPEPLGWSLGSFWLRRPVSRSIRLNASPKMNADGATLSELSLLEQRIVFDRAVLMRQKQEIATARADLERIDRLGQKVHRTRFQGFIAHCSIIGRRDHHHGSVSQVPALPKPRRELHSGHSRHPMVSNDQVGLALLQPSESFNPAGEERGLDAWIYTSDHLIE